MTIICIAAVLMNFAYYCKPVLEMVFDFVIKLRDQKYDHSISKSEANEQTSRMHQMDLDHEYRMAQLRSEGNIKNDTNDNFSIPPANVTDENHKYLS